MLGQRECAFVILIDIVKYFISIYTPSAIYNTASFSTISPTEHFKLLKGFWFAFLLLLVKLRVFLDVLEYYVSLSVDSIPILCPWINWWLALSY